MSGAAAAAGAAATVLPPPRPAARSAAVLYLGVLVPSSNACKVVKLDICLNKHCG